MAADEQARQHAMDDFVMPHDHAADLLAHRPVALDKFFGSLLHGLADTHRVGSSVLNSSCNPIPYFRSPTLLAVRPSCALPTLFAWPSAVGSYSSLLPASRAKGRG